MKIIVCAKQVPNTNEVKIDPVKGTLIRDGVPSILNPDDANALEAALAIKDDYPGTEITVLTMGPAQAIIMLRECLAMGADKAVLLSDRAFAGADTYATSNALASAIRVLGGADIVFAGRQAIDGDTAQVGPQIAYRLNLPQVTYVRNLQLSGDQIIVHRQLEDGHQIVKTGKPVLLTAVRELNEPRLMTVGGIMWAFEQEIKMMTLKDLDIDETQVGLKASPTKVFRSFTQPVKGRGRMLEGTPSEMASQLMREFKKLI